MSHPQDKDCKMDFSSIPAVILAGGLGTRLRNVVFDRPKALAVVCGKPFLTYILDQLICVGITEVVLCTGYLGEMVESTFGEHYGPLHILYSQEPSLLGTAGALRHALPKIHSETLLVINGDSYCDTDYPTFLNWHMHKKTQASIVLTEVDDTSRYGRVIFDKDGRVLHFGEKENHQGSGWINAGIYLIARILLENLPQNTPLSLERDVFPSWIGSILNCWCSSGVLLDIGTPESYAFAEDFFAHAKQSVIQDLTGNSSHK
jgi:D-glycero-alpha-D-manno-heptose 1-phosphate guanylyltransferase